MGKWPMVKLGEVLEHRKEFVLIDDLTEYKRCRVQLHAQGIVLRDLVPGAEIKTKKQQVCKAGDFLVAEIDAKVGGYGIVPDDLEGAIVSSHYFLFTVIEQKLDRRFLGYFTKTPYFQEQVTAQGSTNYAAIRPSHVLDYEISLPPLAEQRRIVAKIDALAAKIDEARVLRKQAGEEAEAVVSAKARDVLSKAATEVTPLSTWLDDPKGGIQTGPFGAQLGRGDFVPDGVPLLTIGNVQYSGLKTAPLIHVTEAKATQLGRYRAKEGDILFARMGTVGRCCVVPAEADGWLFNYHIIRVALDCKRIDPRYVHWSIRSSTDIEEYLEVNIRGATREGVNSKIVGGLPLRVPPLPEQRRIVARLDALQAQVDALKQTQAASAAELDALLPSVLDRAFKGEAL